GLAPPAAELPQLLAAAQNEPHAAGLRVFLDLVASHLAEAGFEVQRLPLLLVPTRLLAEADSAATPDFLLGWNNVVLESDAHRTRAEGFGSLIPEGDRRAREAFS